MREIQLTKNKVAIVDDEDYERVMAFGSWQFHSRGYASRSIYLGGGRKNTKTSCLMMHRAITNPPNNLFVDHINGNKLDNRKSNLRICTFSENLMNGRIYKNNKSGFKGVCLHKQTKKWGASIGVNGKLIHLGLFITPIEAAQAYNAAALTHHGEFAKLNQL